ncbi:MAG: DUF4350 domain-containing protein [Candidatus Eremiobacteraeota bacterium]|nr:DUF4350 domain-containing protein [Candidatus Eremiobacteraeota bacterium]
MRWLRSTEVVIALAVLVCFVLLGWLDYQRSLHAVERFDTFSSYDYQRGGYHAWYDLLRREGIRATRQERRPAYLSDPVATLIVANNVFDALLREQARQSIGYYTDADCAALHRWVTAGGHLVWLVDQASALSAPMGGAGKGTCAPLSRERASSLYLPGVARSTATKDAAVAIAPSALTEGVRSLSGSSNLRIPFGGDPNVTPLVADDKGSVVAWYQLGKGSVVIVTDETLFQNSRIGKADNARLAFNLAGLNLRPGDTVAFDEWTHGYQSGDTWWSIMPRTLQVALSIMGGALLLLLLGATWRFGPAARLPENIERTSHEYLLSMAALLERGGARRQAIRDLAQIALHAAARSTGLADSAPAAAIATRLRGSEAGDRRAHDLLTLERLSGYEQPSSAELVQAARLSRDLRKELSFDGSQAIQPRRTATRRSA